MFAGYARTRRESGGGGETEVMLDRFQVRNRFRERLQTKLKERGYHGREAGGPACLVGGPECEMLRLKGVRRTAAGKRGL